MLAQNEIEDRLLEARKRMRAPVRATRRGNIKNYDVEAWEAIPLHGKSSSFARKRMVDLIVMAL